jgi:Fur family ferric uptake transcriptional regulator
VQIEKLIKDADIKPTSARKEMLRLLAGASKPLSCRDIEAQISMDKATFYRNIAIFGLKLSLSRVCVLYVKRR